MEQHNINHLDHSNHLNHHQSEMKKSEVEVSISYSDNVLRLSLMDDEGNVPELELNHEKLLHLIIVSEDLDEYFHLHPVQKGDQTFEQEITLTGSSYKAFVDIKPKRKNYSIEPIPIPIDDNIPTYRDKDTNLKIDEQGTKEIKGKIVELQLDSFESGKDTILNFDIKNGTPQPYLGALGHVVMIDEKVENFIHVHPISEKSTEFQAHFDKPGLYKLWTEFKMDGEVIVFPYVIKVK
ncbi:hypothetical protein [Lysinibacillus fusiformis]|uniref:hypothetical protein n=1 Tax=Lysinibacillus fusiformis TaxID=28031 RepID=UPI003D0696CD